MIEALDATAGPRLVCAGRDLVHAEALIEGAGKYREELNSIVGKECNGASPERNIAVDENVGGACSTVNSASVVAYMSTRRLKRSVKRRM